MRKRRRVINPGNSQFRLAISIMLFIIGVSMMISIFLFFYADSAEAASGDVSSFTVMWDENVPKPEGYKIYSRDNLNSYNYDTPVWTGEIPPATFDFPQPLPDLPMPTSLAVMWDKTTSTVSLSWDLVDAIPNELTKYMVCRAYEGLIESADSEEVSIVLKKLNPVERWDVFYSETSGGPWVQLSSIPRNQGASLTDPLTVVQKGEKKTLYFTVVAFGEAGSFSPNATEVMVVVDRESLLPPANIKINITIPVE
jgi:hypothetical protein